MEHGLARVKLGSPSDLLLTPRHSQVRTDHAPYFVPVFACQNLHSQHVGHHHYLFEESDASLGLFDVHFGAGGHQDYPADIVFQLVLLLSQAVKHCIGALVVGKVENFLNVVIKFVVEVILLEGALNVLDYRRHVIHPDLSE